MRLERLRALVNAADTAFLSHVEADSAQRSTRAIFETLQDALSDGPALRPGKAVRLPACIHLGSVSAPQRFEEGALRTLVAAFRALEPDLTWYERTGDAPGANAAYRGGHANTMIVGPGGLLRHQSVWLGMSLMAPEVRYPDHTHPPEETYLALSDGDFFQEGRGWFTPGTGGTFYNPPGIRHAMRSGVTPFLAMWALRAC